MGIEVLLLIIIGILAAQFLFSLFKSVWKWLMAGSAQGNPRRHIHDLPSRRTTRHKSHSPKPLLSLSSSPKAPKAVSPQALLPKAVSHRNLTIDTSSPRKMSISASPRSKLRVSPQPGEAGDFELVVNPSKSKPSTPKPAPQTTK